MQAVILAAGKGKRLLPLTAELPKPLISVSGKPILEHILEALPEVIDEVFIVIGYKGDLIRSKFGDKHGTRSLHYVEQENHTGTAGALELVRPHLHGQFLLLSGDDIHGKESLDKAIQYPLALIAALHNEPSRFGVIETRPDGTLLGIEEKPAMPKSNLVSTAGMVLDERVFLYEARRQDNGEYYVTDQLAALAREFPVQVITQTMWIPIGYPEDIPEAELRLKLMCDCSDPQGV